MTDSERSAKRSGSADRRFRRKSFSAFASGAGGSFSPMGERDLDDALPALGRAHHAAQDRETALLEEAGDHAVGRDHEVLDDLLGAVALLGHLPAHRTAVELGPHLDRLEFQRPALVTAGLEALGDPVLEPEVVGQPGTALTAAGISPLPSSQAPTLG